MEPDVIYIGKARKTIIATICFSLFVTAVFSFYTWTKITEGGFNLWLTVGLSAVVLFLDIRCWYWVLDTTPVIVIDREGLLHKKKKLYWSDIESFDTEFVKPANPEDSSKEFVWITVKDDKRVCIDLLGLKTNVADMRLHISSLAGNKVTDKGHVERT